MSPRIIIHVDLDAFYAAVEEREHPECKGKPVVVGADPKGGRGRGVVSTCDYEARQFGIRSGMPISKAWRLNKNAVFLPVNLELYEKVSSNIMRVLRSYGDKLEQVSIDEAFLDLSKTARNFEEARKLAEAIKADILEKEKLTCSIGMGPNKLVAKIASDHQKPNGLTVVIEKDVESFLAPLPVHKLLGIGVKTNAKLNEMGVRTMGELVSYDVARLREEFWVSGISFHQMAQGVDKSELVEERLPKSFSREHTFEEDTSDKRLILTKIDDLLERVVRDCKENGFTFKTLTLKIRYQDLETHTRSRTIPCLAAMPDQLKQVAYELAEPFLGSHKKIRLIGIRVSTLIVQDKQKTLIWRAVVWHALQLDSARW